jgi:hypothetical protein
MTKQLRSKVSGTVVDVIAETDKCWWAQRASNEDMLTVDKDNRNWELFVRVPEVGDVWKSPGSTDQESRYRVLGVDVDGKMVHWVQAHKFHGGAYPVLKPGDVQATPTPELDIFTREYPEEFLEFVESVDV